MVNGFAKLLRYSKLVRILPLCAKSEVREKERCEKRKRKDWFQPKDKSETAREMRKGEKEEERCHHLWIQLWSLLTAIDLQQQVNVQSFMFVPFIVLLTHSQSVLRPFRRLVELLSFPTPSLSVPQRCSLALLGNCNTSGAPR